ncbi:MAG TPA: SCO family protein [Acidimicrobiales bacterium]|nr:SCO family protein [Acidimicrobiales bacterium]
MRAGPTWRTAVALVLAALLASACGGDDDGPGFAGITRDDPILVDVSLTEVAAAGPERDFELRADDGGLLFVYFGYTSCPDLCPTTMSDVRQALSQLEPGEAARVSAAFITVDPERDTPDIMVRYLDHFFDGAHALRPADESELRAVEAAFGASSEITPRDDGGYDVSHTAISYVVDSAGRVVVEWPYGVAADDMAADLRLLLAQIDGEPT